MSRQLENVRLISDAGHTLTLPIEQWRDVYCLAIKNGWQRMGSEEPPGWVPSSHFGWQGEYFFPENQGVRPEDASNMADALVRVLTGLSDARLQVAVRKVICICRVGRFSIC